MPAIAPIVLNDGTTARTFGVKTTDGKTAQFLDQSAGVPIGYSALNVGVSEPSDLKQPIKHTLTMRLPGMSVVNGVPTVTQLNSVKLEWFWSQVGDSTSRQKAFELLKSLIDDPTFEQSVVNAQPYF